MSDLSFATRADLFRVVARFTARERFVLDVNASLGGVRIEPSADGGLVLSASNGLIAMFVHDATGRASRAVTVQRPETGLALVRDAARGRVGDFPGTSFAPRIVFQNGHAIVDAEPEREFIISELAGPYPDFREYLPQRTLRSAMSLAADAGEALAIAARQLGAAAGLESELAASARFATYRDALAPTEGPAFTFVRFSAWPRAFAIVAPDGADHPVAPPVFERPAWISEPHRALESAQ